MSKVVPDAERCPENVHRTISASALQGTSTPTYTWPLNSSRKWVIFCPHPACTVLFSRKTKVASAVSHLNQHGLDIPTEDRDARKKVLLYLAGYRG